MTILTTFIAFPLVVIKDPTYHPPPDPFINSRALPAPLRERQLNQQDEKEV